VASRIQQPGKAYLPPQLQTRTFGQAALFLTGYAWIGNQEARDLLELLFADPGGGHSEDVGRPLR
jgi:hypothetical protein